MPVCLFPFTASRTETEIGSCRGRQTRASRWTETRTRGEGKVRDDDKGIEAADLEIFKKWERKIEIGRASMTASFKQGVLVFNEWWAVSVWWEKVFSTDFYFPAKSGWRYTYI